MPRSPKQPMPRNLKQPIVPPHGDPVFPNPGFGGRAGTNPPKPRIKPGIPNGPTVGKVYKTY